ncbi:MAG TPA: DNA polymerase III subunit gamma/tau [Candidatus Polarisedimenticolaceae bacterium]|nr:DNA polymerase III subunit gamma/tau [Candidatus Polarisedimenticolaceae bacterium]
MYQVLARKWRPQTLDDLVGQAHVARTLRNALTARRIAHAYVFAGVRGTGKTTVARILAKSLNCAEGPTATPCNRCVSCTEITEGRSLDVMELDAASRTGVDNIRELQEVVSYAPVRDRYRVLIIDEAHMLSKAAFNALLKTLEEPPPQVVFVLATTEMQKLLPTILSRCQVFEFHRVSTRDVSQHLRRIADAEGVTISDRTLDRVARAGEGSMRDALSVLERVLAFCGSEVGDDDAMQVLGSVRTDLLATFIRGFAGHDPGALLQALDALVDEGHDFVHFWAELIGVVRDLMLVQAWPEGRGVLARAPEESAILSDAAEGLSLEDLTRIFQILAALEHPLKSSSQPRFLFEGALIRIASLGSVRPIEEILASLEGKAPMAGKPATQVPPRLPSAPQTPPPKKKTDEPAAASFPPVQADLRGALLTAVTAARPMLGAMLDQASSVVVDGGSLRIAFGAGDDGLRRMLANDENTRAIERIATETLGRNLTLRISGAADGAAPPEPSTAAPSVPSESRQQLIERAGRDPEVRRLLRDFGAQIVDARSVGPAEEDGPTIATEETT